MSVIKLSSETSNIEYDKTEVIDAIGQNSEEVEKAFFADFIKSFVSIEDVEEAEPEWIVKGIIPKGTITLLASDGGVGKTSSWINLLAALSSGKKSLFDTDTFPGRKPIKVAYLSSEDSTKYQLKRRLKDCGADEKNIITYDEKKPDVMQKLKIGSPYFEKFVSYFKPGLVVLDPLQGFLPPDLNMGARNAMRDNMQKLISMGDKYGTTFLIICHANKRKGAYGRDRLADSADLWDAARSVLMAGFTEDDGIRYISHEKCNYGALADTFLYKMSSDATIEVVGRTKQRDRDYQQSKYGDVENKKKTASKTNICADAIIDFITENKGRVKTSELDTAMSEQDFTKSTVRRAKDSLREDGKIRYEATGFGDTKEFFTILVDVPLLEQVSNNSLCV